MTAVTLIVMLSRVITSCGGTVSVTIRRSTFSMREMNGMIQNKPGPFAPVNLPKTKITPRSYCCTTRRPESTNKSTTARIVMGRSHIQNLLFVLLPLRLLNGFKRAIYTCIDETRHGEQAVWIDHCMVTVPA